MNSLLSIVYTAKNYTTYYGKLLRTTPVPFYLHTTIVPPRKINPELFVVHSQCIFVCEVSKSEVYEI